MGGLDHIHHKTLFTSSKVGGLDLIYTTRDPAMADAETLPEGKASRVPPIQRDQAASLLRVFLGNLYPFSDNRKPLSLDEPFSNKE